MASSGYEDNAEEALQVSLNVEHPLEEFGQNGQAALKSMQFAKRFRAVFRISHLAEAKLISKCLDKSIGLGGFKP